LAAEQVCGKWTLTLAAPRLPDSAQGPNGSLITLANFADTRKEFPVLLRREFGSEVSTKSAQAGGQNQRSRPNSTKFPVFFPVSRELDSETSSLRTASSATDLKYLI